MWRFQVLRVAPDFENKMKQAITHLPTSLLYSFVTMTSQVSSRKFQANHVGCASFVRHLRYTNGQVWSGMQRDGHLDKTKVPGNALPKPCSSLCGSTEHPEVAMKVLCCTSVGRNVALAQKCCSSLKSQVRTCPSGKRLRPLLCSSKFN